MTASLPQRWQFVLFVGVSLIATAMHYGTMVLLASGMGFSGVEAASVGYLVGAFCSYILNYRFTFSSTQSHHRTLLRFLGVVTLGFIVNRQIVEACIAWGRFHYLPAQGVATGIVFLLNFLLSKVWAFKEN
jgi:putative flippase GtrA